jgi:hypothetical protein
MRKELVKEIRLNNEGDLKKVKKYLFCIKSRFNKKYFDELKSNQNIIRRYIPVITVDAYNLLDATPSTIAVKNLKENAVAMMEIYYSDNIVGKLMAHRDRNRVKLYIEYTEKNNSLKPLLTIF